MKNAKFAFLAVICMVLLLAACSNSNNNTKPASTPSKTDQPAATPDDSSNEQPKASDKPALPEPATIRLFTENSTAWPVKPDWGVWKWIKEETNITIEPVLATGPESLALAISSGDMPDVLSVFPGDVQKYGPQGAFIDLAQHLDQMPNVKAYLDSKPDVKERVLSPTGEMFSILNDGAGEGSQTVWMYREDIFKKHNLAEPKTWDDLYATAKKLKELYPDSYPFAFRHGLNTLNFIGPSFGIYPEMHPDAKDPSKMKYGLQDPAAKTMVGMLNKFLEEGLIPPDWLTMDYKAWAQFMTTNKSFIAVQFIGQIEIINSQLAEGTLKFMVPPIGAGDQPYLAKSGFENYGLAVSSTTKNLDASLRYLDYIFSAKGRDIQSWGKEGETYTVEGGKRKFNANYKEANDLRVQSGIQTAGTYGWFDFEAWLALVKEEEQASYREAPKYRLNVSNILPVLTTEEAATVSVLNDQIWKFWTGEVTKFIFGDRDMSEWETFVKELDKYDIATIQSTYQTALDRLLANTK
ncbi:extracellular solute-binding protein [Paenibacillus methanolicus]|uniref:Putative aldouronate transport system substrate-binding protein n=1 Tax=Paenibacillus methanolicus TaxID=582686 RepID=A0A5S5CJR8_9BACL|nr:extracellular solute-binding protein [Paenibacillus methanolicus]TYP78985.1 putative aldouronate transport system substrate-binding protein [Paenibacillus methanolicus]